MTEELNERISTNKNSTIGTFISLVCKKFYGDNWQNDDSVLDLIYVMKYHYPAIYEAFYEHCWGKVSQLLNEDGTGSENTSKWREII